MTKEEAIEQIKKKICCEYPVQHFCTDDCRAGDEYCEFAIALNAIAKAIPRRPVEDHSGFYSCRYCQNIIRSVGYNFCPNCGQAIDWSDVD